jgi:hypothetical protein
MRLHLLQKLTRVTAHFEDAVGVPSWTSIFPRDVQTTDIDDDTESKFQREMTWSSLPEASIPLREKASAVTFPPETLIVWLLKYSTGGGS